MVQKNKGKPRVEGIVFLILIHAVLPTLILTIVAIFGIPMDVVARFAPDIFMVQIISSVILYLTGAFKVMYRLCGRRKSSKMEV